MRFKISSQILAPWPQVTFEFTALKLYINRSRIIYSHVFCMISRMTAPLWPLFFLTKNTVHDNIVLSASTTFKLALKWLRQVTK